MILSILFYPNIQKINKKTGKIPMYVRVVLNRKKAEMRLNIEILPQELNKWDEKMMRFSDREMQANALLNKIEQKFQDFRYHNATSLNN